jgi:hypothetical protein
VPTDPNIPGPAEVTDATLGDISLGDALDARMHLFGADRPSGYRLDEAGEPMTGTDIVALFKAEEQTIASLKAALK